MPETLERPNQELLGGNLFVRASDGWSDHH
jgi:hypothetical protein